ncbi:speckle-type POZ protein B, partial [Nephila pilipes]
METKGTKMNVSEVRDHLSSTLYSETGTIVEAGDNLDPVDFLIVTGIPVETYRFKWIVNQFGNLSIEEALYSTETCSFRSCCCKLKLRKYENGFGLLHIYQTRKNREEKTISCGTTPSVTVLSSFGTELSHQKPQISVVNNISCDDPLSLVTEYQVSAVDKDRRVRIRWTACFSNSNKDQCHIIGEYK